MTFQTKSFDELRALGRGLIRGLVDKADVSEGSDYDLSAQLLSAIAEGHQEHGRQIALDLFPETASLEALLKHLRARGLERALPTGSTGRVQITATSGTPTQALGSELAHADGTTFTTTQVGNVALPAWVGKTTSAGSTHRRLLVSPNTTGMAVGDIVEVNGEQRAIKDVLSSLSMIDLYEPLTQVPAVSSAIAAVRGVVVTFESDDEGATTNKAVGDVLTLSSPATGVVASCRIVECGGGGDIEQKDEIARRLMAYDSNRPAAGNAEHVRLLARETPGVRIADACVFPSFRGLGSVDVVVIGVAGARVVPSTALPLVAAHVKASMPEHVDVSVLAMDYETSVQHLDLTVRCAPGYERDFAGGPFTIAASPASTTTRIYLTTDPTSVVRVGHRVIASVRSGGMWGTYQREVSALNVPGSSPYFVDLVDALPAAPVSTDPVIVPGGPLFDEIDAALRALFDELGPSRKQTSPTTLTFRRVPDPAVAWDDVLRRAALVRHIGNVVGTSDVTVTTPATDQTPTPQKTWLRGYFILRFTE